MSDIYYLEVVITPPPEATEVSVIGVNLGYSSLSQRGVETANAANSWTVQFLGLDYSPGDPGVLLSFVPFDGADYMEPVAYGPYDLSVYGEVASGP
ncbi:hypothetical protein KUV59_03380 [Marinobacter daepoensis]|uniref:hypothetical protein n=1 Tax=Marinobacter daepoensis TaxID=262077 RepID=UPI001C95FF17|nr:hypothetical protein [Marinobacter daepoensis]MBY6032196.1 hypothetical protein [Marinobacter daepoensis]